MYTLFRRLLAHLLCAAALAGGTLAAQAGTVTKAPDGPGPAILGKGYSTVYANTFVAPNDGNVSAMGVWMSNEKYSTIRFDVYRSLGGDIALGPDTTQVVARSAPVWGDAREISYFGATDGIANFGGLVEGQTYWLGATVVDLCCSGNFAVATHTQNSGGIVDDGIFMWSNDPAGRDFIGPWPDHRELAFSVTVTAVPEPMTAAMLALGAPLAGLAAWRRRGAWRSARPPGSAPAC